jgi:hypothetical protein
MARTGYTTYWVPQASANMAALRATHQRTFPGNLLSIIENMVKVAVLDGDPVPRLGTTTKPTRSAGESSGDIRPR